MVSNNAGNTMSRHEMGVGKATGHDKAWMLTNIGCGQVGMRKSHGLVKCGKIELN